MAKGVCVGACSRCVLQGEKPRVPTQRRADVQVKFNLGKGVIRYGTGEI